MLIKLVSGVNICFRKQYNQTVHSLNCVHGTIETVIRKMVVIKEIVRFSFDPKLIMKISFKIIMASMAFASFASCSKDPSYAKDQSESKSSSSQASENFRSEPKPEVIVIKAAGNINAALKEFRDLLGTLNSKPGATGGRREVNWDGGPADKTNNNLFPGDFFAATDPNLPDVRKRGLINTTPGTGFSISDNDFSFLNAKYDDQFDDFSPAKTFIAVGSNITDNFFKVPGTNIDATVKGFGVVFSDVNNASSTSMEFYNGDRLLGSFKVPNVGNNNPGGFSFLGVYFPNEKVTRVRIFSGSAALSATQNDLSDGGGEDLVVMDDFIYSEPEDLE